MTTRREFTLGLAAATAGLALRAQAEPKHKHRNAVYGGITVGVQSYSFRSLDLDHTIEAMGAVGLASVELWMGHLDPLKASEDDFKAARRKLDAAGIAVNAYCANFPTDATDEHLDRAFRGAKLLGAPVMTSSVEKPLLPRLDQWCEKYKMRVGLHNHWLKDSWFKGDPNLNFGGPEDFIQALEDHSKYLSINLDIGHFTAAHHDPVGFFREYHKRIVSLHIKDRDRDAKHTYVPFGTGATPIGDVLRLAQELRFRYAANIEYEVDTTDVTEGVRRAFAYVRHVLG